MRSTFGGIETSLRALRAQQLALEVTGHNISNANTPGYSRQVADMSATDPYSVPTMNRLIVSGQIGTGVEVTQLRRMRDLFIDRRIQYESAELGYWDALRRNYDQLEVIMAEPAEMEGGASISAQLTEFWNALQELGNANRADNPTVRSVVRERANNLCATIRATFNQLKTLQQDLNAEIGVKVGRINTLAQQIAELNGEIAKVVANGDQPNDLFDKREVLVTELAKLTKISVQSDDLQRYNISISGSILVNQDKAFAIETRLNDDGLYDVVWANSQQQVNFTSGELQGLLEMRDVETQYYIDALNEFTTTLVEEFNAQHASGYGLDGTNGHLFFAAGSNAATITLDAGILDPEHGLSRIAASASGEPGDGKNALELADLIKNKPVMKNGTLSLTDFYGSLIAKLGIDAEKANVTCDNKEIMVNHLNNLQESVAGVSLDEEMANMIKFQNAYHAAARLLTAVDQILDRLINGTGTVGL